MKTRLTISWIAQVVAAVIMLQTLYFKFTAAPESVYIFSTLGLEPTGRIGSGFAELMASLLLLWPRWAGVGAVLGLGIMGGAITLHLTKLGIEVQGDGGYLFILALIMAICCSTVAWIRRRQIPIVERFFWD